jgi:hypothetical protein
MSKNLRELYGKMALLELLLVKREGHLSSQKGGGFPFYIAFMGTETWVSLNRNQRKYKTNIKPRIKKTFTFCR